MNSDLYLYGHRELEEGLKLVFLYILPRSYPSVQLSSDPYSQAFLVQSFPQILGSITLIGEEGGDMTE